MLASGGILSVKLHKGLFGGLENVTRASIDIMASRKKGYISILGVVIL